MNNWQSEVLAEKRRTELLQEAAHLELERIALSPPSRRWLGKSMLSLADWMIATGRQLHDRYEKPSAAHHSPHSPSTSPLSPWERGRG